MTIDLPKTQMDQLGKLASNAGYATVEVFVKDCLFAIASGSTGMEDSEWTEEELRQFAAMCDRGMEDVKAGRVMSVEEARRRSHENAASRTA